MGSQLFWKQSLQSASQSLDLVLDKVNRGQLAVRSRWAVYAVSSCNNNRLRPKSNYTLALKQRLLRKSPQQPHFNQNSRLMLPPAQHAAFCCGWPHNSKDQPMSP